jgi:ABC-type multidrug transport system ATPase subunit
LARRGRGANFASIATEALIATRLWDQRNLSVAQLSPSQAAACELLGPLTSGAPLVFLDGALDLLDPWTLQGVIGYLRKLQAQGVALVVATNRAGLAGEFDAILVLSDEQVCYAGRPEDLVRRSVPHVLSVTADDQPGVQALVSPFSVSMRGEGNGVRMVAEEGQELAARLLLEGYGNVRCVLHRPPTLEEALLALIR